MQRAFDGLGLRGNDSAPVSMQGVGVTDGDLITPQGEGAAAMLQVILPWFNIGSAAMSNGLCRAAVGVTAAHMQAGAFEHTGTALRDLPTLRARLADMSVRTEQAAALLDRTITLIEGGAAEAPLFVLLTRLASIEAAVDVTDLAMKACGGAASRATWTWSACSATPGLGASWRQPPIICASSADGHSPECLSSDGRCRGRRGSRGRRAQRRRGAEAKRRRDTKGDPFRVASTGCPTSTTFSRSAFSAQRRAARGRTLGRSLSTSALRPAARLDNQVSAVEDVLGALGGDPPCGLERAAEGQGISIHAI